MADADGWRRPTEGALGERRALVEALWVCEALGCAIARVAGEDARRTPRDAAWLLARRYFAEPDVTLDGQRCRRPFQVR